MRFHVRVTTKSSNVGVLGTMADGALKVGLRSVPEQGKANEELRDILASHFQVEKSLVRVVGGGAQKEKWVEIPFLPRKG